MAGFPLVGRGERAPVAPSGPAHDGLAQVERWVPVHYAPAVVIGLRPCLVPGRRRDPRSGQRPGLFPGRMAAEPAVIHAGQVVGLQAECRAAAPAPSAAGYRAVRVIPFVAAFVA